MQFLVALPLFFASLLPSIPQQSNNATPPAQAYKQGDTVKLLLDGEVDEKSMAPLVKAVDEANAAKASRIVLEINSPGGKIMPGLVLAKRIERSQTPVTCIVDGEADSMASFILESCQTRVMTKRSAIMIHQSSLNDVVMSGHPTEWQNVADDVKLMTQRMAEHYCQRMKITVPELLQKTDGGRDWNMGWKEALKVKAVDFVVDSYSDLFPKK